MLEIISKILLLILTNFVFAYSLLSFFFTFTQQKNYTFYLLVILSLGFAPLTTSLILYYLFLFAPGLPVYFYLLSVCFFFTLIGYLGRKNSNAINRQLRDSIRQYIFENKFAGGLYTLLVVIISAVWLIIVSLVPINSHDMFEHATFGRNVAREKEIEYEEIRYFEDTRFHYIGAHAYGFPLAGSWEQLINTTFSLESDYYLRSLSGYFLLLLVSLIFGFLKRYDAYLALGGAVLLLLTPGIGMSLVFYHLDTMRIFLLCASIIQLIDIFDNRTRFRKLLLAVTMGFSTFVHMFNTFYAALILFCYFIFMKEPWSNKFKDCFVMGVIVLIFGGIHYILDSIWGTSAFNTLF